MKQHKIREFYETYCKSLEWIESLVEKIPSNNRFYQYKETLKKQMEVFESGIQIRTSDSSEMKDHTESQIEAFVLTDVFEKFSTRTDEGFRVKLREMLFGPKYSSDEEQGNLSKSSFGRDIESELMLASKFKNPDRVSFSRNDIVYDLEDCKFGFECKRIHSDESIMKNFAKACDQLESNPDTKYGFVVFRLDKYLFIEKRGGIVLPRPILMELGNRVTIASDKELFFKELQNQGAIFYRTFYEKFARRIVEQKYEKVAGYCVCFYLPCFVGNPITINAIGFVDFTLLNFTFLQIDRDPMKKIVFKRIISELDFQQEQLHSTA